MSSTEQTITLADVIGFVGATATDSDLDAIHEAARLRRKHLGQVRAATMKPGDRVELKGLNPKYLNGLRGTVEKVGKHVEIELDAEHVSMLQFGSGSKFLRLGAKGERTVIAAPPTCAVPI